MGLNVINHWNKHRIRLFLEAFATLQASLMVREHFMAAPLSRVFYPQSFLLASSEPSRAVCTAVKRSGPVDKELAS